MSNKGLIEQTASLLVTVAYANQEFDNYDHVLHHGNVKNLTDALELADKRIAELEKYGRVQDPLADRIAELERKLAVAREALIGLLEYAGIIEERCDSTDTDKAREALAQIGGEDARS